MELRRLWQLYVKTTTCTPSEAKAFKSAYAADVEAAKTKSAFVCTSSRAAGPLSMYALKIASDHYNIYWETGICSAVSERPLEVSYPNPTLAYSMVGDKFGVHYGTDPLACFHLAEAFAPAVGSARHPEKVTLKDVISVCKTQFSRWCTSVSEVLRSQGPSSPSPLIIRCFVGDALSLCQALDYSHITKSTSTPFPLAPWKTAYITLDHSAYGMGTQSPAPTMFNVIDTSNLLDHIGMLNILVFYNSYSSANSFCYVVHGRSLREQHREHVATATLWRHCDYRAAPRPHSCVLRITVHEPVEYARAHPANQAGRE